jgi:hypothetical protein
MVRIDEGPGLHASTTSSIFSDFVCHVYELLPIFVFNSIRFDSVRILVFRRIIIGSSIFGFISTLRYIAVDIASEYCGRDLFAHMIVGVMLGLNF